MAAEGTAVASKAQEARRANFHYMADAMRRLEWDLHQAILTGGRIPEDWHAIAREAAEPPAGGLDAHRASSSARRSSMAR